MLCRLQCYSFHFKMLKERVDWLEALLDYTMLFVSCNWRLPEAKLRVRKILCQHITYRISLSECLDFFSTVIECILKEVVSFKSCLVQQVGVCFKMSH